jgi:hypothetical protein
MTHIIVSEIKPRLAMKLRRLPLFQDTRFVKPGRLLTTAEWQARQRHLTGFDLSEIRESYVEELRSMQAIAHSITHMNMSRARRLRKIRNHSGGMSRRIAVRQ